MPEIQLSLEKELQELARIRNQGILPENLYQEAVRSVLAKYGILHSKLPNNSSNEQYHSHLKPFIKKTRSPVRLEGIIISYFIDFMNISNDA